MNISESKFDEGLCNHITRDSTPTMDKDTTIFAYIGGSKVDKHINFISRRGRRENSNRIRSRNMKSLISLKQERRSLVVDGNVFKGTYVQDIVKIAILPQTVDVLKIMIPDLGMMGMSSPTCIGIYDGPNFPVTCSF